MRDIAVQQSRMQQHCYWSCPSSALHKLVYLHSIIINESHYILNILCYKQVTLDFYSMGRKKYFTATEWHHWKPAAQSMKKGYPISVPPQEEWRYDTPYLLMKVHESWKQTGTRFPLWLHCYSMGVERLRAGIISPWEDLGGVRWGFFIYHQCV